ncbi:hypothetical protein FA13DRAFT_1731429 [Coprinellus micaceus]|uniref:Uncharacterized protein n=1 Tax=Coprinellus micaceus TaxID=71717 RepID=A0A4Y7TFH3_COPMI|nr:hypothetical protein FA13DRAFT_1731429 [Coprinellus micaceus]
MPYQNLLLDVWSTDPATLLDDAALVAETLWGHLIHHFSTPGVYLTWDESSPRRIRNFLLRVAVYRPLVRPSCAFRAMLVVLSIKEKFKGGIAYGVDAELLWHMAFKSLAARHDPTFTDAVFTALTLSHFAGSKLTTCPKYIDGFVRKSLTDEQKPLFDAKIVQLRRYYLAPWLPGVNAEALEHLATTVESPFMPSYTLLKPKVPTRAEQTLVFPDPRRQYHFPYFLSHISCLGV